jgi:hypothetical protein
MATTKVSELTTIDELKATDKLLVTTMINGEPKSRAIMAENIHPTDGYTHPNVLVLTDSVTGQPVFLRLVNGVLKEAT